MRYQSNSWQYPLAVMVVVLGLGTCSAVAEPDRGPLRVCADPNNLPFSNDRGEGLENALAELVARSTGRSGVEYTWRPQRRGFVRNTLNAGRCEVIMGVPSQYELAEPTRPYYRSTYVFVYRDDADFRLTGMDDPRLRDLQIGVHVVGDDYSSTPGAAALARRGIIDNLVGFSVYGDYSEPHPPSRLIEAVASGDIDVAIAWGPLAGYFGSRQSVPLRVQPLSPVSEPGDQPFTFDIAMATRHEDRELRAELDHFIATRNTEISNLLAQYGVPMLNAGAENPESEGEQ